jgi:hypothetical protein
MAATPYVEPTLNPYETATPPGTSEGFDRPKSTADEERIDKIIYRHRQLQTLKIPWLYTYQLIGEYVMTRKQDFTIHIMPGMFLTGKIFDSTAPNANHFMASALLGALWPNAARSFDVHAPHSMPEKVRDTKEVKEYYSRVSRTMAEVMDDPRCGLALALEEYMYDQGAFGVSGIHVKENKKLGADTPLHYCAVDAKKITIAEGADGFVDTCFIERDLTFRQVVQEYGIESVSNTIREGFQTGNRQEDHTRILHAIEPRLDGQMPQGGFGNRFMKFASVHIELDHHHILDEGGYNKIPALITRFWKTMNEVYGRSPAMEAMPDILEANELREAIIIAVEKLLNPPLALYSDGALGNQVVNTSAGKLSVLNLSGRMLNSGIKPLEPIVTVGELKDSLIEVENVQKIIERNFFIPQLTDLNNTQRQTLGEANIRNQLRGQSLGTIYSRQIAELFSPLVERTFDILMKQRRLGVIRGGVEHMMLIASGAKDIWLIPDAVAELIKAGKEGYRVRFLSPAARTMRSEELAGIQQTLTACVNLANVVPDVVDNLDFDAAMRHVVELTGAPMDILNGSDVIDQLRKQRAAQQQEQQAMAMKEQGALTAKHGMQAVEAGAKAGVPPQATFQLFGDQGQEQAA